MERLPHVFLVGAGAARFAREIGAEEAELLTDEARAAHAAWLAEHVPAPARAAWPDVPLADHAWRSGEVNVAHGTTVFIARDRAGHLAAGTSTAGTR